MSEQHLYRKYLLFLRVYGPEVDHGRFLVTTWAVVILNTAIWEGRDAGWLSCPVTKCTVASFPSILKTYFARGSRDPSCIISDQYPTELRALVTVNDSR